MRQVILILGLLPLLACGGTSPTSPSPAPVPVPSPAPIIAPDPALFDATFNAQLVHDALESSPRPSRLLHVNPAIYLQTAGLDPALPAQLEAEARAIVPLLSGGLLSVASFTSAPDLHPFQTGAIVVEIVNDPSTTWCGLTNIGASVGYVRLNVAAGLHANGLACTRGWVDVFGHELGHALGFYHVTETDCLMSVNRPITHNGAPCDKERYHAGLAYQSNGAYQVNNQRVIVVD